MEKIVNTRLRDWLKKHRFTMRSLALALDMNPSTVYKWATYGSVPHKKTFEKLSKFMQEVEMNDKADARDLFGR